MIVSKNYRLNSGNILILSLSLAIGLLIVIGVFMVNYNRFQGTVQMQTSAIEAAALTTAGDISKIVYNDPYFGYVALSDHPPIAPSTSTSMFASDGYPLPVQSINVIIGTIALDSQIINNMSSSVNNQTLAYMNQLVNTDYNNLQNTVTKLTSLLQSAVSGSICTDWYGNSVNILKDAQTAYNNNLGNGMTQGGISHPAHLNIQLGYLNKTISTNIPTPNNYYNYISSGNFSYCYMANQSYNINGMNLVFSAIGNNVELVNVKDFSNSPIVSSQTIVPTIVKVSASQQINITSTNSTVGNNSNLTQTIYQEACAIPYNQLDPRPNPGGITFRMPQGILPNNFSPITLMNNNLTPTSSIGTGGNGGIPGSNFPNGGDYLPTGSVSLSGSTNSLVSVNNPKSVSQAVALGIYDWLRNAGVKPILNSNGLANLPWIAQPSGTTYIGTLVNSLNRPFQPGSSHGTLITRLVGYVQGPTTPGTTQPIYDTWYPAFTTMTFGNYGQVLVQTGSSMNIFQPSNSVVNENQLYYWGTQFTSFTPQQLILGQNAQVSPFFTAGNSFVQPGPILPEYIPWSPPNDYEMQFYALYLYAPWLNIINNYAQTSGGSGSGLTAWSSIQTRRMLLNWFSISGKPIPISTWSIFDSTIRDNSYVLGTTYGGNHAGQPNLQGITLSNALFSASPYQLPPGITIRPTYLVNGTVADLRFFTSRNFSGDVPGYTININQPLTNPNN